MKSSLWSMAKNSHILVANFTSSFYPEVDYYTLVDLVFFLSVISSLVADLLGAALSSWKYR